MYSLSSLRLVQKSVRSLSTSPGSLAKNLYDSLGITPKATQADIKRAYYKLSMVYHPDKNSGSDEAAQKFRDISEAYEVLGNVRLRKLYDKGFTHMGVDLWDDPTTKFYKSREHRTRPPSTGQTPIYDFDEWSRSHYGTTFAHDMKRKRKTEFYRHAAQKQAHDLETARLLVVMGMLGIFMVFSYGVRGADEVTYVIGDESISRRVPKNDR